MQYMKDLQTMNTSSADDLVLTSCACDVKHDILECVVDIIRADVESDALLEVALAALDQQQPETRQARANGGHS